MKLITFLTCAALLLGPGAGGALAAYRPGEIGLPARLALAFVSACVVPAVLALILALAGFMDPLPLFVLVAVATAALWFAAVAKGRGREHLAAVISEIRADPWALGLGLAVIVAIAVLRLTYPSLLHFSSPSSWRYWADAVEVADAGRIPDLVLQYGTAFPAVVNKALVSTFGAGLAFALGREPLSAMAAMLWLSSVGLAVAFWALGSELGLRLTAPLLPVLLITNRLFLNQEMTADLNAFRAETFGRMVAFTAAALGVRALRERRWKHAILAGSVLGLGAGMHAVPVLIAGGFVVFYAVAWLLVRGDLAAVAGRTVVVGAVAAVIGGAVLFVPRGDVALAGVSVPEGPQRFDPTRFLNSGQRVELGETRRWYIGPRLALNGYVSSATGLSLKPSMTRWLSLGLAVAGLAAVVATFLWAPPALRPVGIAAAGLAGSLVAVTWLLSARYRLYIPAFFGVRRLFDYSSIPVVVTALALAEWALLALQKAGARTTIACAVVIVGVVVVLLPTSRPGSRVAANQAVADAFSWIRTRVPCEARIFPDVHTQGVFETLTGRVALLEGPTPYLRPGIRDSVIRLFLDANRFLQRPRANRAFLERQGVDYVVLTRDFSVGYRGPVGTGNKAEMDRATFLRRVHTSRAMDVYQVLRTDDHVTRPFAPPEAFPGFVCERDPIAT